MVNEFPHSFDNCEALDAIKKCKKEVEKYMDKNIKIVIPFMSENIMVGIQK